jgi:hypothetical protein
MTDAALSFPEGKEESSSNHFFSQAEFYVRFVPETGSTDVSH